MRVTRPSLRFGRWELPAFYVFGPLGFALGSVLTLTLTDALGLDVAVEIAVIAAVVLVFLALTLVTKALTGREMLVHYHHVIATLAVAAVTASALGGPVRSHLDVTALGIGVFVCFGRLGCLRAGCCHGRPARRGVVYGDAHRQAGFPSFLVGVPLVPVQVFEAIAVGILVVAGVVASGGSPGTAFSIYLVGYALVRFALELQRGDLPRRSWRGLSEPQWTSLAIALVTAVAALAGLLAHAWALASAAGALLLATPFIALRRDRGVLDPGHLDELARSLPSAGPGPVHVAETSMGLRMSAGQVGSRAHYTLSRRATPLAPPEAHALAQLIVSLRDPGGSAQVLEGAAGAYHVVLSEVTADGGR